MNRILAVVGCLLFVQTAFAGNGQIMPKANSVSGRYIVMVNGYYDIDPVRAYATQLGGTVGGVWYDAVYGFALQSTVEVATTLSLDSRVTVVEQDETASLTGIACPTIQQYPSQSCADGSIPWQLDAMDSSEGYGHNTLDGKYAYNFTGYGVRIYVVDTGIHGHPDVSGRIVSGFSFVNDTHGTDDLDGHGTTTASIAAGTKAGPAKDAELIAVRVPKISNVNDLVSALSWVQTDMRNRVPAMMPVVNFPWSMSISSTLDKAVLALVSSGAVVVTGAGNNQENSCNQSPSHLSQVITAGAVQRTGNSTSHKYAIWPSSGAGSCVTLMAPGVGLGTAHFIYNDYDCNPGASGTSQACALTSGMAALYMEANPGSTPAQIKQLMLDRASYESIDGNMRGAPMLLVQRPATGVVTTPEYCYYCQWYNCQIE